VNSGDIGVIERSQNFRFTLKPGQTILIAGKLIGQDFNGDFTFQLLVFGSIGFTESTLAEQSRISYEPSCESIVTAIFRRTLP
jgi:hypothetical protein